MQLHGKIHFITCVDMNNCGDYYASPLNYYYGFFKDYCLVYHDINSVRFPLIQKSDIVILGGGGLLDNSPSWNNVISQVLDTGAFVIGWSLGFHEHVGAQWPVKPLDFEKFGLIAVRDFEHESGLDWLPCVTCMSPCLQKTAEIKREIGIINHQKYPIGGLPYDKIDNQVGFDDITDFIASSEVIITSSYHAAYWAMLMNKIVICTNEFSHKFYYFKEKPQFLAHNNQSEKGVADCITKARENPSPASLLSDYIALNHQFFLQVKQIVAAQIPLSDPCATNLDLLKATAELIKEVDRLKGQDKRAYYLTHPVKAFLVLRHKLFKNTLMP